MLHREKQSNKKIDDTSLEMVYDHLQVSSVGVKDVRLHFPDVNKYRSTGNYNIYFKTKT